jgi:hypothetical protein
VGSFPASKLSLAAARQAELVHVGKGRHGFTCSMMLIRGDAHQSERWTSAMSLRARNALRREAEGITTGCAVDAREQIPTTPLVEPCKLGDRFQCDDEGRDPGGAHPNGCRKPGQVRRRGRTRRGPTFIARCLMVGADVGHGRRVIAHPGGVGLGFHAIRPRHVCPLPLEARQLFEVKLHWGDKDPQRQRPA